MSRKLRLFLPALVWLLTPQTAWAHSSAPGIEGFYIGLLHPFTVPGEIMALLGLGMLLAFQKANSELIWKTFALTNLVGLAVAYGGWISPDLELPLIVSAIVTGLCVASALPLNTVVALVVGAAIGFPVGIVSMPDPGPRASMLFGAFGGIIGVNVILFYLAGGIATLLEKFKWPWIPISLRVVGSWIAAISLLLFALAIRPSR